MDSDSTNVDDPIVDVIIPARRPVGQNAHPLTMVSFEGVAAAGWWKLPRTPSMATVQCFTLKRRQVQGEERWALG